MKKFYLFVLICALSVVYGYSQKAPKAERTLTIRETGMSHESGNAASQIAPHIKVPLSPDVIWEATDGAAILNYVKTSSVNNKTAAGWGLNDQRLSLYGPASASPEWEAFFTINAWDESVDMTDDGLKIVNGYNDQVEVYEPASSTPVWTATVPWSVRGVQIKQDGLQVFVAGSNLATQDSSFVYCYTVGQSTPVWKKAYIGNFTALVLSRSGNRLLLGEYGSGHNKLYVINPTNGSTIYETVYNDQYIPAISDDGKYIVSGDFSSHVFLLEYSETAATYHEKWNATVNGSNSWVCGMGISGDGSTIAVGTLIFTPSGAYDGELYVYDNNSPVPLWTYPNMGDMVQCVDVNHDGSIIASAGWGPLDNSYEDIHFFRRQSNVPYLAINSPGSNFALDLTPDGKRCAAGGKAVHAREFGMGGELYYINCDPGGGNLNGLAVKSGSSQQSGVKVEITSLTTYFTFTNDSSYYNLLYIPAGTYDVTYSAIGYVTQTISGVQITSGQTTVQDVVLQPTGVAPQFLTATQGAGLTVDLSWTASPTSGVLGYNIYRKQYSFESFPAVPIGTTGPGQLTYTDVTALPTIHYYYTVTASLPSNLQTPYSNEAEGWIATGFITNEISAWTGTTPVIDGVISPGEWSDAFKTDISNFLGRRDNINRPIGSVMAWFKVNSAKTELYVAVDNTYDTNLEDHDEIALYVDDNNDGFYPAPGDSTEGNFWAVYYSSGNLLRYRPIYSNGGVGNVYVIPNAQVEVSNATGHIVYEFVVPIGSGEYYKINFNAQNQSGLFAFALDDPSNYDGWWPCENQNIFTAEGYGVITFGAIDEVPPAPLNLMLDNPIAQNIMLHWDQPNITDFDHFNIYMSQNGGTFTKLDTTIGVQYFYTAPANGLYKFYVTTVDQAGHESPASNTVETNVVVGIDDLLKNDISMVKMGPNPFSSNLNIDYNLQKSSSIKILITDMNGKSVKNMDLGVMTEGSHHLSWAGTDNSGNRCQAGMYIVQLVSNDKKINFRIIRF